MFHFLARGIWDKLPNLSQKKNEDILKKALLFRAASCLVCADTPMKTTLFPSILSSVGLAVLVGVLLTRPAPAAVVMDWVTIGNPNNAAQSASNRSHAYNGGDGYGSVGYVYAISRNETTIGQYVEFLNAVEKSNSHGLYNTSMANNLRIAGISRSGSNGSLTYSAIGSANHPIAFTSWFDAARFANWMHNGQGNGSTETGAYTLNGAMTGIFTKNVDAKYWIPSENEWYKAAYYNPATGNYSLYATGSDSTPQNAVNVQGAVNYKWYNGSENVFAVTQNATDDPNQNYLTDVGAYGTQSFYGINDMNGNVYEWNDAVISANRGLRGGSWVRENSYLLSSNRGDGNPTSDSVHIGFRLAGIPEPSSLVLVVLGGAALLARRARKSAAYEVSANGFEDAGGLPPGADDAGSGAARADTGF